MSVRNPFDGQKVLITGGKGFIGSHLAEKLLNLGAYVTILDAGRQNSGSNDANIADIRDSIEFIHGDLRAYETVLKALRGQDVVFHTAAQVSRIESIKRPIEDIEINCVGTMNVLLAAKEATDTPRVVFTSSRAVYGTPTEVPVTEASDVKPVDVYGTNKLAAELYCEIYDGDGLSSVVARPTNVYGPRAQVHDTSYGVINAFVRKAIEDEVLTVFEPGTMTRDCIYVSDAVNALLQLGFEGDVSGEVYNVGIGKGYTIMEIAETIVDIAGSGEVELVKWPDDWTGLEIGDFVCDNSKAKRELDWEPSVSLSEGLERTIDFYEENLEKYT